jgi:4-amino-4-deoxy-L-arabinose transferase-like glycosyltransferase
MLLALAPCFCRTAHGILLDNALTAAVAWTLLFTWMGLEAVDPRAKRGAYAAAGLFLGFAFLVKGMVGPAIFGSGLITYLLLARRASELKHALQPLPLVAFLAPVALWVVPFLLQAPEPLVRDFSSTTTSAAPFTRMRAMLDRLAFT